jgi:predicted transcriptional regulator
MAEMPGLSEAEMEVLKALWAHGPATVRRVNEVLEGRRWAYTTVLTLLQRLLAKGYAVREAAGVAHVFRAALTREEVVERRLKETADELCDGSAAPLLLALVQGNTFTPEEIARFRRLLKEAGGKPRRPSSRRGSG